MARDDVSEMRAEVIEDLCRMQLGGPGWTTQTRGAESYLRSNAQALHSFSTGRYSHGRANTV